MAAHGDPLSALETRMARLEAMVFGANAAAHVRLPCSTEDAAGSDVDLHARAGHIACHIPTPPGQMFEALVAHLSELGLDSTSAIRRELATPLGTSAKKALIAAEEELLRQLAQYGTKVGELSSTIGGDAWALGRDETSQLAEAEARAVDLIHRSSSVSRRVDMVLETYDSAVGTVSEKIMLYNNAAAPGDRSSY
jgi:hypothetical protein